VDYNLYHPKGKKVTIAWTTGKDYRPSHFDLESFAKKTGQGAHSLQKDPLWKDRSAGDYTLRKGSPALDGGAKTQTAASGEEQAGGRIGAYGRSD